MDVAMASDKNVVGEYTIIIIYQPIYITGKKKGKTKLEHRTRQKSHRIYTYKIQSH